MARHSLQARRSRVEGSTVLYAALAMWIHLVGGQRAALLNHPTRLSPEHAVYPSSIICLGISVSELILRFLFLRALMMLSPFEANSPTTAIVQ